jgi:chlorobactene glucosyltransferase
LFTDADTVHAPDTVARAVAMVELDRIDFFSLIPFEEMGTPMEHIVIPMVHVLYFAYLPNELILRSKMVSMSAANGQFMWFSAAAYARIGGHVAVRNDLVEDVALAKHVKRVGLRTALVDGSELVRCRMYTSARDVIDGFSKNFFPAMGYNLPLMIAFIAHLVTVWTLPLILFAAGMVAPDMCLSPQHGTDTLVLLAVSILCGAFIRLSIARRFGMPAWHAFLQPMSAAIAAFIGLRSVQWAYSSAGALWKGRSYSNNRTYHVRTDVDR